MESSASLNEEEDTPTDEPLLDANTDQDEAATSTPENVEEYTTTFVINIQRYAAIAAHVLAVAQIVVVYWWISVLGGLSAWRPGHAKQVFNWHPLLMITAFCFMTVSSLSFKALPWRRNVKKLIHGSGWFVAAASAVVGLVAVFQSHNDGRSGYIANMYSLHSWIGMTVIVLYVTQFFVGVRAFGGAALANASWSAPWKRFVLQCHVVLGPLIYVLMGLTILLGIQEKEGFVGCAYHVNSPDLFPLQHVAKIPAACLVSHLLGLLVFLTLICTTIALAETRRFV